MRDMKIDNYPLQYPKPTRFRYRKFLKFIAMPFNNYVHHKFCVYKNNNTYFSRLKPNFEEDLINQCLSWQNQNASREALECFIYDVPLPIVIEPSNGWAYIEPFFILDRALTSNYDIPLPSIKQYLKVKFHCRDLIQKYKTVISLRTLSDCSYSHTLIDVLGKIALLKKFNYLHHPILISESLSKSHVFKSALSRMNIPTDKFIVQTNQFIFCDRIIYGKTEGHTRNTFDEILSMLNAPEPPEKGSKRLFIWRTTRIRIIINFSEIRELCEKFDIEIIDSASIPFDEQISLFSQAQLIVGMHGAGLINMMFRRGKPLSVLEIFPNDFVPPQYYWLASQYRYNYDAMIANDFAFNPVKITTFDDFMKDIYVDVVKLRKKLEKLLI